jgi:hypothetical protein
VLSNHDDDSRLDSLLLTDDIDFIPRGAGLSENDSDSGNWFCDSSSWGERKKDGRRIFFRKDDSKPSYLAPAILMEKNGGRDFAPFYFSCKASGCEKIEILFDHRSPREYRLLSLDGKGVRLIDVKGDEVRNLNAEIASAVPLPGESRLEFFVEGDRRALLLVVSSGLIVLYMLAKGRWRGYLRLLPDVSYFGCGDCCSVRHAQISFWY